MQRGDFLSLLIRLAQDRKLDESQAGELLRQFDKGEIKETDLPLTLKEAIQPISNSDIARATAGLKELGLDL